MDDDWDLQAVVRGCCSTATTTTATTSTSSAISPSMTTTTTSGGAQQLFSSFTPQQDVNFSSFQDLLEPRKQSFFEDLQELYKPFFRQSTTVSPLSVLGGLQDLTQQTQIQPKQAVVAVKSSASHNPTPRSKRRKNHLKRVCHVPADSLSDDKWSWRKYGQKPIKGSPYPRGYYKCSTSKGCMARKQVERNRSDPGMFIVTYTAEHNHPKPTHRNSLAGSTRQKPTTSTPSAEADDAEKPTCSTPVSTSESPSTAPEKVESSREEQAEADGEDDEFSVSNMDLDDDFFVGLEEFTGPDAGDLLSDQFPATVQFPWHASNATTTAAGSS